MLNKAECNYSFIHTMEVLGMKQFRHYLLGRPFELWTDHKPLKWLANLKLEKMLGRWALALQEYSFSVVHHRGSQNTNADSLSRRRDPGMSTLPSSSDHSRHANTIELHSSNSETGPSHQAGH